MPVISFEARLCDILRGVDDTLSPSSLPEPVQRHINASAARPHQAVARQLAETPSVQDEGLRELRSHVERIEAATGVDTAPLKHQAMGEYSSQWLTVHIWILYPVHAVFMCTVGGLWHPPYTTLIYFSAVHVLAAVSFVSKGEAGKKQ